MTREDKELLLKDLCARLPYHTKIDTGVHGISTLDGSWYEINRMNLEYDSDAFLPYLRPMSCMTEKEKVEIQDLYHQNTQEVFKDPSEIRGYRFYDISVVDWLNEHHFDYRGLIEKGLALEASKNMYK